MVSAGCGLDGAQRGDFHLSAKDGRGTERDLEVIVPASYDARTPLAITFLFHGAGGTQEASKAFGMQDVTSASESSVFVFPQGVAYKNFGVGWDDSCAGYDMVFFDNMLSLLRSRYCIDPKRVFVAGFSWGCDFVTALACCRGDRIRAVGAASCSDEFSNSSDYQSYANYPCPSANAAAIRFTHDVQDDGGYTAEQFATTARLYRGINSCAASSAASSPAPCVAYQQCSHDFVECAYAGLGHALPGNWASETWDFFVKAR